MTQLQVTRFFLFAGLAGGMALTAYGLLTRAGRNIPPGAVAVVNGQPIGRELYERAVQGAEADRDGKPLSADERKRVLSRMIDEQLLVEQAVDMGMAGRDRMARGYLVQAMIEFVTQQAQAEPPPDGELRSYYDSHRAEFAAPGRLALRVMNFDVPSGGDDSSARSRGEAARAALRRGDAWEKVEKEFADPSVIGVPRTPMSAANVLEYLGPTATRAAFGQKAGQPGDLVRTKTGFMLIEILQRWDDMIPPFETAREEVVQAWRRARTDAALRDYLDDLRRGAVVHVPQ